jgi:periplasmic protein TonB
MSTQAILNRGMTLAPMHGMVDSLKQSVSALANFDGHDAQAKCAAPSQPVANETGSSITWMPPLAAAPVSRLRQGGLLAFVVLAHVVAAYVLTHQAPQVASAELQPLQVALFMQPQAQVEQLLPPPPVLQQPTIELPIEPVLFDIAAPDTTAITVAARVTESAPSSSVATGTPKTVSSVEYLREPQPKYPPAARALKQRGTVTLRVLVDTEGHAREVNLHRTSGYRILDDAARKAVLEAQFKPYMENGHALAVYVLIPIEFEAA